MKTPKLFAKVYYLFLIIMPLYCAQSAATFWLLFVSRPFYHIPVLIQVFIH